MSVRNSKTAILWFRKDLRLHDNESLVYATNYFDNVIPVYVFDERLYEGFTSYGFPKIGGVRRRFSIESVIALRESLREKGSDLILRYGRTEEVLFDLSQMVNASFILCNKERTAEEVEVQNNLEKKLWKIGTEILFFRGKMLYYTADLPFPIKHTPDTFNQFKKEIFKVIPIREPLNKPKYIHTNIGNIDSGDPPWNLIGGGAFSDWSLKHIVRGGEQEALRKLAEVKERLNTENPKNIKTTFFEKHYSTHLSPWISMGCLSPKLVYKTLAPFAEERKTKFLVGKIINHLLYRDFCRFMAKKYKEKIFFLSGIKEEEYPYKEIDSEIEKRFRRGLTGIPLIDAQVRKLTQTGFLTTESRKILASFLIFDLKQPWLYGAELFENLLIDYDPASNYVNWGIVADVFNEPRGNAYINIVHQSERFDTSGTFVKRWLPELKRVDEMMIHYPWKWEPSQRKLWHLPESVYPTPIVSPK